MKKGINLWAFPPRMDFREAVQIAKSSGFHGVEVNLEEEGHVTFGSTRTDVEELKKRVEDAGLELTSVCSGLFWKYSLTSDVPEERDRAGEIVRTMIQVASWLGVRTILVVPGAVENPFVSPTPRPVAYDAAYERSLTALRHLARDAEDAGVTIGVENVWNKFLLSPLEMASFVDAVGSPNIGCYLDAGNVLAVGYPEQWIRILGHRIKQVHVKDFRKTGPYAGVFVDLLEGDVNWRETMDALRDVGYDGYLVAEYMPLHAHPQLRINQLARAMTVIIGNS